MVECSLYEEAVETWGPKHQLMVTMGELAECTAEMAKVFIENREVDEEAMINEIADVCIMMSQMEVIYGERLVQAVMRKLKKLKNHVEVANGSVR